MKDFESTPFCLVSACLCGIPCRFDGSSWATVATLAELYENGLALAVCPEVEGGLPVPRTACELKDGRVVVLGGGDLTEQFHAGAVRVLQLAQENGINIAILKESSPSCGSTMIHDGSFSGRCIPGQGVTAALLMKHGIRVVSEHNCQDVLL